MEKTNPLYLAVFLSQVKSAGLRSSLQGPPTQSSSPVWVACGELWGGVRNLTWKKGWFLTSCAPWGPAPSRFLGSLQSSRRSRSCATGPIRGGKGGEHFRIRLGGLGGRQGQRAPSPTLPRPLPAPPFLSSPAHRDTSACVFLSPSSVKGEAPVSSSKSRMPRLHQSTACRGRARVRACGHPYLTPPPLPTHSPPANPPCHAPTCCG